MTTDTKTAKTGGTAKANAEPRGRLRDGIDTARERAASAAEAIEANPLGILVGGAALGALVGALLPRSEREKELLAPIGKRVSETAAAAIAAARETGQSELENLGLTKGNAQDQVRSLLKNVGQAAGNAGKAAASAGRDAAKGSGATGDA